MGGTQDRAPIALFVYNRADLTRQTIEALARNQGAAESDLVIFSDGPKSEKDTAKVAEVRALIADIRGFRSVRSVRAPQNQGLAPSIIQGVTALAKEHGQVIVMEDDLITSPTFLDFMHDGLNAYRNEPKVGAISGYSFPLGTELPETFFLADETCWGWATWDRAWEKFEPDGAKLLAEIRRARRAREFDVDASFPFCKMLEDQIAGRNSSWAIRWRASLFLERMLSLYPAGSLVRNIGADGSGTHATKADTLFDTDLRLEPVAVRPILIQEDKIAARAMRRYFRKHIPYGLKGRIAWKIKRLISLIF